MGLIIIILALRSINFRNELDGIKLKLADLMEFKKASEQKVLPVRGKNGKFAKRDSGDTKPATL